MRTNKDKTITLPIVNLAIGLSLLTSLPALASESDNTGWGGDLSASYTANTYDKSSHNSLRSLNWSGKLKYSLTESYAVYLASGGYRVYEGKTGDFFTDTVIGFEDRHLATLGDSGKLKYNLQLTLPTSELSRDDELESRVRLALSYAATDGQASYFISPRLAKNFHRYQTAGDKSLPEWLVSLNAGFAYQWDKLTLSASLLGGTSWSYQHTRQDWTYSGAVSAQWQITEHFYTGLSLSNSGVYFDAEQGTVGDIDLFNDDTAVYSLSLGYTF